MKIGNQVKRNLAFWGQKFIVGVSGGIDSMVLIDILVRLNKKFIVAHVNYNLRVNSFQDYLLVKNYCLKHNIEFYHKEITKVISGNIQAQARKIRLSFFKHIANLKNINQVLVAHHLDDHLETYFLQKKRNIFVSHYGLKKTRSIYNFNLIRPMLNINKQQIKSYAKIYNVSWNEDISNQSKKYQRNLIRKTIVNDLSNLKKIIIKFKIKVKNYFVKKQFHKANKLYIKYIIDNKFHKELFLLPKIMFNIIIYKYLKNNHYPIKRIDKKIINEIINFQQKTIKNDASLNLAANFKFVKQKDIYYVTKEI